MTDFIATFKVNTDPDTHGTAMNASRPVRRRPIVLPGAGIVLLLAGCAITRPLDVHVTAYTYSTFDFSGNAYSRARKFCDAKGHKLRHLSTDCGFFLCTSTFECSP